MTGSALGSPRQHKKQNVMGSVDVSVAVAIRRFVPCRWQVGTVSYIAS